jgi:hypothetical protein
MTENKPRAPTPSVIKYDIMADFYGGNLYPAIDYKDTGFAPYFSNILY